ncbi:MAG: alpha-E domain-containing protein [Alphaproteobacteria bacterium]|nr:alpha-E domain-containing protein [Alphaproteobacteria bacterium]
MSNLLARFAANIFWMARYLERAESLARILDINETYARDNPQGPDWKRALDLYGDTARFKTEHDEADAASVLYFYVLDRANPTSIAFAIAEARQNARSVRHLISTEMWTQLNIFHNYMAGLTQRDIRLSNLSKLCTHIKLDCQTIEGIAEGTLLRGEAWRFYQLGKYIERADQTTRVLDIGYERLSAGKDDAVISVQWNSLLRSVAGYHAYRSRHPAGSYASDVAAFLLYDEEFARAVALCVNRLSECLHDLNVRLGGERQADIEKARRSLEFTLETGLDQRFTVRRLQKFVDDLQVRIGQLSETIGNVYFNN